MPRQTNLTRIKQGTGQEPSTLSEKSSYYLEYPTNLEMNPPHAYELSYNPKSCSPVYQVMACSCSRHVVKKTCMNLDCIVCHPRLTLRRAVSAFKRLKMADRPVIYTIFTIPIMERYRFINPESWQKVRRKAWGILRQRFGAEYGVEASHPIGDKDRSFHPHLNFLWVQREGLSPYINVELLRDAWATAIGVNATDVHTEYSTRPDKIMHMCKYALRTFPGYMHWVGSVRWYGKYPKMPKNEPNLCPECGERFHYIGRILEADFEQWHKTGWQTGSAPPWQRDDCIIH